MSDQTRAQIQKYYCDKVPKRKIHPALAQVFLQDLTARSRPLVGLVGSSAIRSPLDRHIALLSDSCHSLYANAIQRAHIVNELQRCYGNSYVQRVVAEVRAKLAINNSINIYKKEADGNVYRAIGMPKLQLQKNALRSIIQHSPKSNRQSKLNTQVPQIQRDVITRGGRPTAIRFRVGQELTLGFVQLAKRLAGNGRISKRDLFSMRRHALRRRGTVNDNERMFMAGLLNAGNVSMLRRRAIRARTSIVFGLNTITIANINRIINLGRQSAGRVVAQYLVPTTRPPFHQRPQAQKVADRLILRHAGAYRRQARRLINFAKQNALARPFIYAAMLGAASDNTAADKVMAGTAYAVAYAERHTVRGDVISGRIKVDAIPSNQWRFGTMVASYVPMAQWQTGIKGDTVYLRANTDITNTVHRATIIHELEHAWQDKQAPPGGRLMRQSAGEVGAYRAEARYLLKEMRKQSPNQRKRTINTIVRPRVGNITNLAIVIALMLEARLTGNRIDNQNVTTIIARARFHRRVTNARLRAIYRQPAARILVALQVVLRRQYPGLIKVEGLSGESVRHRLP